MISLFYNGYRNPNGAATFTEHLVASLKSEGEDCIVYKVAKVSYKKPRSITKYGGVNVHYVTLEQALELAIDTPSLVVNFMQRGEQLHYGLELAKVGIPVVYHGPGSFMSEMVEAIDKGNGMVIFVRPAMIDTFAQEFDYPNVAWAPHPYVIGLNESEYCLDQEYWAVAIGRIAREKRINIICDANTKLFGGKKIALFGLITDSLYEYHTLRKRYPEWRNDLMGPPQDYGLDTRAVCRSATYAIDLSSFTKDGGGSQYTFLEAMEADSLLIINKGWLDFDGEMSEGFNCLAVSNSSELVSLLSGEIAGELNGYEETLYSHSPELVAPIWLDLIYGT